MHRLRGMVSKGASGGGFSRFPLLACGEGESQWQPQNARLSCQSSASAFDSQSMLQFREAARLHQRPELPRLLVILLDASREDVVEPAKDLG